MAAEERSLEIRRLEESDLTAAMRIKESAGWNQTEADWRRLLTLEPRGCFAAWIQRQLVATTTTTRYGSDLAWVGMVLVDPAYRRQGIARHLMVRALEYLKETRTRAVKLDATPAGRPLYESMGFRDEGVVERWAGIPRAVRHSKMQAQSLQTIRSDSIAELDHAAFGADRSLLLETLLADSCVPPRVVRSAGGELRGYALARGGTAAAYIGPLIARDCETALVLLDGLIRDLGEQKVYLDFYTGFDCPADELEARGFAKQRDLFRMGSGESTSAGTSALVFSIAGPEIG